MILSFWSPCVTFPSSTEVSTRLLCPCCCPAGESDHHKPLEPWQPPVLFSHCDAWAQSDATEGTTPLKCTSGCSLGGDLFEWQRQTDLSLLRVSVTACSHTYSHWHIAYLSNRSECQNNARSIKRGGICIKGNLAMEQAIKQWKWFIYLLLHNFCWWW